MSFLDPYENITNDVVYDGVRFRVGNFGQCFKYNRKGEVGLELRKKVSATKVKVSVRTGTYIDVDILVAMAFLDFDPNGDKRVAHINGDTKCYYLDNLKVIHKSSTFPHPSESCNEYAGIVYSNKYKKYSAYVKNSKQEMELVGIYTTIPQAVFMREDAIDRDNLWEFNDE